MSDSTLTMKEDIEDRFKVATIRHRDMLMLITGAAKVVDLPEGSLISDVQYNWESRSFELRIHHGSWPIVEQGTWCIDRMALTLERVSK